MGDLHPTDKINCNYFDRLDTLVVKYVLSHNHIPCALCVLPLFGTLGAVLVVIDTPTKHLKLVDSSHIKGIAVKVRSASQTGLLACVSTLLDGAR